MNGTSGTMITGPLDIFYLAGRLWNHIFGMELTPFFEVEVANSDGEAIQCDGGLSILPQKKISQIKKTDLILIPSIIDLEKTLEVHADAIPWIHEHYKKGAQIAANACFDISLYLVQKMTGREIALQTAKVFICDLDRIYQSEWTVFKFQQSHKDDIVLTAQKMMEKNYSQKNMIEKVTDKIGINRRSFERRFKAATGDTPLKYIHRLRVEAAKRIIETTNKSFDEIAYQIGYENSSYFRKIFKELCHISPKLYNAKWGKITFPEIHATQFKASSN